MSPEIDAILQATAAIWVLAVMCFSIGGFVRMYRNGRDGVEHPRREVVQWVAKWASLCSTAAAMIALVAYFFGEQLETDGLVSVLMFVGLIVLLVVCLPIRGRHNRTKGDRTKEDG